MIHTDQAFSEAVAQAVGDIETRTDAEIVVVAAARSATYAEVSAYVASMAALVMSAILLAIPWHIAEPWFLLDLTLTWLIAERLARSPWLTRRLTTTKRRDAEVMAAAHAEFLREAIHGTPNRTGVLVYVSALEGMVAVIPDLGIAGRVPKGELVQVFRALRKNDLPSFLEGLRLLGDVLARYVPHHEGSDTFDMPNAPRIRP